MTATIPAYSHASAGTPMRVWLLNMAVGTYLTAPNVADPYIWTGKFWTPDGGTQVALLFRPSDMAQLRLQSDSVGSEWRIATEGEDLLVRRANDDLRNAAVAWADQYVTAAVQREWEQKARADWKTLNDLQNEYAIDQGYCSTYDDKVESWNEQFKVLQLESRVKDREVEVTVTGTWRIRVDVERTRDDDEAERRVSDMTFSELLEAANESSDYPDDYDIDIRSVEVSS